MRLAVLLVVAFCCVHLCICAPLIKVFCSGAPVYRGRVDSIVAPGVVSGHVHKVSGGSNFGPAGSTQTPLQVYNDMLASPCTTCSIKTVDQSAYWHPDLYYRWPNNTLSLVPSGGLTVYYLARSGSGNQSNPAWRAFPPGFRMISGNPFRRTFNASSIADQAIEFVCLGSPKGGSANNLTITQRIFCQNGLRLQIHFPQCWDGQQLDTPDHSSHMRFPISRPDGGDCPPGFPVRLPNLFFEAFYSVSDFPHGPAPRGDGTQRFVLANGDSTGYGFHADFLNGWVESVLQSVLRDPSCDSTNTNNGNDSEKCAPITQYVTGAPAKGACNINHNIPLTENMGIGSPISTLPGCNTITSYGDVAPICSSPPSATEQAPATVRFHLKAELNQKFFTCPPVNTLALAASVSNVTGLTYYEVFGARTYSGAFVSLLNEGPTTQYLSASGPNSNVMCNRGSASDWEAFQFVAQANGKVAIISRRNNKYLTVNADGTMAPTATAVTGPAQLFTQVVPSGGSVF